MKILKALLTGHTMYIKMSLLIMPFIPWFLNLITPKTIIESILCTDIALKNVLFTKAGKKKLHRETKYLTFLCWKSLRDSKTEAQL